MSPEFLALDALLKRFVSSIKLETGLLPVLTDSGLGDSECIRGIDASESGQHWRPVERADSKIFEGLEQALELRFPDALKIFYGSFWSESIYVEHSSGLVFQLIQLWNPEDEERLKENILGHVFAKRKNRLPINYFIACTDGNEVVCLDHESGKVILERPGYRSHQVLAESLDQFLLELNPLVD